MARPSAKDGIRARTRKDGIQEVHLEESPGHWIASPERDREKALLWAKRNRHALVVRTVPKLSDLARGFFSTSGAWAERMRAKGHHYVDKYLLTRQGHLDNYIVPAFGDMDPRELTRRMVDDWLLEVGRSPAAGQKGSLLKPLAGATRNKIMLSFSILLEDLVDREILEKNPIDGIRPYSKTPVEPRGAMSREELSQMFATTHGELVKTWRSSMWACAFLVMGETGLRPGELRALRWADWNAKERFFPVRKAIEAGTTTKEKGTKTGAVKPAFVSLRTAQELEIWRAETLHATEMDWIFTIDGNAPVTDEGMVNAFRRGLKTLGIDATGKTPYWLRHSFNTYALELLDEGEVQRLMGHSSTAMTRLYRHPDDESLLRAGIPARDALDRGRGGK